LETTESKEDHNWAQPKGKAPPETRPTETDDQQVCINNQGTSYNSCHNCAILILLQKWRIYQTYRQKKEATIQALITRAEVLTRIVQNAVDLIGSAFDEFEPHHDLESAHLTEFTRIIQLALGQIEKTRTLRGIIKQ
jgi:hypothetical protein